MTFFCNLSSNIQFQVCWLPWNGNGDKRGDGDTQQRLFWRKKTYRLNRRCLFCRKNSKWLNIWCKNADLGFFKPHLQFFQLSAWKLVVMDKFARRKLTWDHFLSLHGTVNWLHIAVLSVSFIEILFAFKNLRGWPWGPALCFLWPAHHISSLLMPALSVHQNRLYPLGWWSFNNHYKWKLAFVGRISHWNMAFKNVSVCLYKKE